MDEYLLKDTDLHKYTFELISGDKNSPWLIVNETHLCVLNSKSANDYHFWECRFRWKTGCPFKECFKLKNAFQYSNVVLNFFYP